MIVEGMIDKKPYALADSDFSRSAQDGLSGVKPIARGGGISER
jgi:hypothetical protein